MSEGYSPYRTINGRKFRHTGDGRYVEIFPGEERKLIQIAPSTPEPTIQLSGRSMLGTEAIANALVDAPDGELIELK